MIQYFQVGVITQPHGIHGEVKVFPISDDIRRFDDLKECYLKIKKDMVPVTCTGVKYFKNLTLDESVTLSAVWSKKTLTLPKIEKRGYICGWNENSNSKINYFLW